MIAACDAVISMWIHERPDWPRCSFSMERLACGLADIRHSQGRLLGRMEGLGFELSREAHLRTLTVDAVASSAIEGETLDPEETHSSIARRLGLETAGMLPAGREAEGAVEMLLDATHGFSSPLTKSRLCGWHAGLFPSGRSGLRRISVGEWRREGSDPMRVVSGPIGRETVHFEAPCAQRLEREMAAFLAWMEAPDAMDPVLRAGQAHLWFVTIHPFEDGNGRIGRAIADLALARADGAGERFYSLSAQMESERKDYYLQLERQQRGTPDITGWLEWFLGCLGRAVRNADDTLDAVLRKARLRSAIGRHPVHARQRRILGLMMEEDFRGFMNTAQYAKLAKCSTDTALRDIRDLQAKGILLRNRAGGRSTSYRLMEAE